MLDDARHLIKVSKASIFEKIFEVSEDELRKKLSGEELEESLKLLPTDDEKQFMRIIQSKAPELARLQRKISVCLLAEIKTLEEEKVEYEFNNKTFSITTPTNSFVVSKKYQIGLHDAVQEMNGQDCIKVDKEKIDLTSLAVDELNLLIKIIDRFFFQTYL